MGGRGCGMLKGMWEGAGAAGKKRWRSIVSAFW